jgi:glucose-6-phosphate 1-dehydrogenase
LCIQPDEGTHLRFLVKTPDVIGAMRPVDMEFHYRDFFSGELPDAYEVLLLDALEGDASLFIHSDSIRCTWELIDPILRGWEANYAPLPRYAPGSWGPAQADELIARDGRRWWLGCLDHGHTA